MTSNAKEKQAADPDTKDGYFELHLFPLLFAQYYVNSKMGWGYLYVNDWSKRLACGIHGVVCKHS